MAGIYLRVGSKFDEQSARAEAKEAQRFWLKQEAQLKVDAQLSREAAKKVTGDLREQLLRKSADITVEAKLAQTSARQVVRDAQRIGHDAGNQFNKGLTSGIDSAVSNYTAQFGVMGNAASNVFTGMSSKAQLAAVGVAGVGLAAVGAVSQLYQMGSAWDDVSDSITGKTGAMGADLQGITDIVKDIGATSGISLAQIGDIAGSVSQSLHLTGDPLKQMTDQLSGLKQVTGQDVDIRALGKSFRLFELTDVKDQVEALNQLATVSQATGAPINELINTMQQSGKIAAQFGLDFGSTAGLLTVFEQAGLDADTVARSLTIALKNLARDGKEPQAALRDTVTEIQRLHQAGQETAAINLAQSVFGRGYADFLAQIENGSLDVDALNDAINNLGSNDSINAQREATKDWHEEWVSLTNTLTSVFEPAASYVFSQLNAALQGPKNLIDSIVNSMKSAPFTGTPGTPGTVVTPDVLSQQLGLTPPTAPPAPLPPPGIRPNPWGTVGPGHYAEWYPRSSPSAPTAPAPTAPSTVAPSSFTAPNASTTSTGYPGDAALLANVPAGRYAQVQAADLTQGLGDCSSAVEDLVNLLDSRSTAGRAMSTHNAAEWLTQHGFMPGMGGPGDFRVGFNSGHMQATLPGGTPFNWGSAEAAARGGVGGTGADDAAFTSHYYRPGGGSSSAAQPFAPGGNVVPVYVTNWDGAMTGSGGAPSAQFASGGGVGPGSGGSSAGGFDPLGSFFSGLQSGGGWGGLAGGIGQNVLSQLPSAMAPAGLAPPGIPNVMAPNVGGPGGGPAPGPPQPQGHVPGSGGWQPGAPAGGGGGGLMGQAMSMFPGGQTASQLASRAIEFGGQALAIGASGIMETFLPAGSSLGDPSKSWFGKMASGFGGARPSADNTAGKAEPAMKVDPNVQRGADAMNAKQEQGPVIGQVNFSSPVQNEQSMTRDIERQISAHGAGMAR